jgi:CheY-like chemotaxis protein
MAASKILLVDDDEMVPGILHNLLEREGFDVTVAGRVAEALKLISTERYDVLLSDLHMPGVGRWPHCYKRNASRQSPVHRNVVEQFPGNGCCHSGRYATNR